VPSAAVLRALRVPHFVYPERVPTPRKPKLGQNFLVDDQARHRIADALGDLSQRTVVEIGPGHGAITDILAPRCRRLIALELDHSLAAELTFRFREHENVEIREADVLQTDLAAFANPGEKLDIIGNLPYYITSDILLHLFAQAPVLHRAVLMMQREVADRIAAAPGVKDYGALSAFTQMHAQVDSLFTLPPSAFNPPPDVFSSVVRLHFAPRFAELGVDSAGFNAFLRQAFAQKRKTLQNNLRNAGHTPEALVNHWPPSIPARSRAEQLTLEHMATLYRALSPPTEN
jgi:16S rRNA (adenine1518-N6/adenine1519-N6)-dimethyltransferase